MPAGWEPVGREALETAMSAVADAMHPSAVDRVRTYYDPSSQYAGSLLTALPDADPGYVDATDLFAVAMLSIDVNPLVARKLLDPGSTRSAVRRALAAIPPALPISALDAEPNQGGQVLHHLETAYTEMRTAKHDSSNSWEFAAKLCARKRPFLSPVRDNLVCQLIGGGGKLRRGGVGSFQTDIQVFAYLMTRREVTSSLSRLRGTLEEEGRGRLAEASDLRLLDVVLWTKAVGHWD